MPERTHAPTTWVVVAQNPRTVVLSSQCCCSGTNCSWTLAADPRQAVATDW